MFELSNDDIFNSDLNLDMILNPVNCKGVSGAGLAKAFAHRFTYAQANYESVCKQEMMAPDATGRKRKISAFTPGDILHYIDIPENVKTSLERFENLSNAQEIIEYERKHIVYFPTKNHWKRPSKLEYIDSGLKTLRSLLEENETVINQVERVGIPALGCGLGGLDPVDVSELIYEHLHDLDYTFVLFEPLTLIHRENNDIMQHVRKTGKT